MDRATDTRRPDEPTVSLHHVDNRFLPLRVGDLVRALQGDATRFGALAAALPGVATAIRDVIEQEACRFESNLVEQYDLFNPDRETVLPDDAERQATHETYLMLLGQLDYLLEKANFEQLDDVQIASAIRAANSHGLKVRIQPEKVEHIALWVRGHGQQTKWFRTLRAPLKGEHRCYDLYRRLAVIVRLKGEEHLLVKIFKDIPQADIEALLPHAEVQMTLWDRVVMLGSGAGVAGTTGMKLFGLVAKAAALTQALWVLLIGLGTIAIRTALGYRRAHQTRNSQRTEHLYFQNLSNNAGAIHAIIGMITEEEVKEAVLGYAFCRSQIDPVRSEDEFRSRIEAYLQSRFGIEMDFDAPDAIETLDRLDLWEDRDTFDVLPPNEAITRLKEHWNGRKTVDYHLQNSKQVSK